MARSLSNPTVAHQPKAVVKEKDRDPVAAGKRDAAFNRSASFNYFLSDKVEAGVALRGTEVKSIREGKANLKDAYGLLKDGECFLLNAHMPLCLCTIWVAHIGFDRALGYGLKYATAFKDTHLGKV